MSKTDTLRAFREARYKTLPETPPAGRSTRHVPNRSAMRPGRQPKEPKQDADKVAPVKKAKSKKVNSRSKKQAKVMRLLKKAYPIYLEAHPECEIKSPVCTFHATVVNHNRGRGANVLNQDDWCPSCPPCNNFIEENHAWAQEKGFKARRIGPKTAKSLL